MGLLTGFALNSTRDFGPKTFTFLAGWGKVAYTGSREIPYFASVDRTGDRCLSEHRRLLRLDRAAFTRLTERRKGR